MIPLVLKKYKIPLGRKVDTVKGKIDTKYSKEIMKNEKKGK